MTQFTEEDEGKPVVNANGERLGIVVDIESGTAHVNPDPDPAIKTKIMASLGWRERGDEETYPLRTDHVEEITGDEVRLASTVDTGT